MENESKNTSISINEIKKNNDIIYSIIERIVSDRRDKRIPFERDGIMDENIKGIFERETRKCLEIYKLEFSEYRLQGKEGVSFTKEKETADCFGGIDGLLITSGMQDFVDKRVLPTMKKLGYSILPDGLAVYNSKDTNPNHEVSSNIKVPEKYVGSIRDQMDYFATLFARNGIDMDWVLDALPHEAMHTFGVDGGNDFIKEGTTENLTREICEKYGIHMSPTSHTQEAEFIRKLEIVVGRDRVIQSGMWAGKFKEKHFRDILENNSDMSFEELSEIFELLRYEPEKLEKKEPKLKKYLDDFTKDHPDVVDILSEKVSLYRQEDKTERYSVIAAEFSKNLGLPPNAFYTYAKIFENLYSLNLRHKTDPDFYRDLYSMDFDDLENGYKFFDGKNLSNYDLEKLKEIKNLSGSILKDNTTLSFNSLMKVIDNYIQNRDFHLEQVSSLDYSSVLELQQDEISYLTDLLKLYNLDEKSETTTILPKDVLKVALNGTTKEDVLQAEHIEPKEETNSKEGIEVND